jgi:hypothetical protein
MDVTIKYHIPRLPQGLSTGKPSAFITNGTDKNLVYPMPGAIVFIFKEF